MDLDKLKAKIKEKQDEKNKASALKIIADFSTVLQQQKEAKAKEEARQLEIKKANKGDRGDKGDKGDKGDPGATPIKGFDYWTKADQEELIKKSAALLPKQENITKADVEDLIRQTIEARQNTPVKYDDIVDKPDISKLIDFLKHGGFRGGGLSTVSHDTTLTGDGTPSSPLSATAISENYKTAISDTDTTPDYLLAKLVQGSGITLTQNNIGGDETITIDSTVTPTTQYWQELNPLSATYAYLQPLNADRLVIDPLGTLLDDTTSMGQFNGNVKVYCGSYGIDSALWWSAGQLSSDNTSYTNYNICNYGLPTYSVDVNWWSEQSGYATCLQAGDVMGWDGCYWHATSGYITDACTCGDIYARQCGSWVDITCMFGIGEAPNDGEIYARQNDCWVDITANIQSPNWHWVGDWSYYSNYCINDVVLASDGCGCSLYIAINYSGAYWNYYPSGYTGYWKSLDIDCGGGNNYNGCDSIYINGCNISLCNDVGSGYGCYYYGTDAYGNKGWYADSNIACNNNYYCDYYCCYYNCYYDSYYNCYPTDYYYNNYYNNPGGNTCDLQFNYYGSFCGISPSCGYLYWNGSYYTWDCDCDCSNTYYARDSVCIDGCNNVCLCNDIPNGSYGCCYYGTDYYGNKGWFADSNIQGNGYSNSLYWYDANWTQHYINVSNGLVTSLY